MAATLRPRHPPSSLYFSTPLISPLQASEPTTANSWPSHGVGERRRHDLMAPLIYPRREIKKPMSSGSSSWLLCGLTLFCDFFVDLFKFLLRHVTILTPITFFWTYFDFLHGLIFIHCTWYESYWKGIRTVRKSPNKSKNP